MSVARHPMEHTLVYRLWQAPFAEQKLAPVFRHNDRTRIRRVLDVGCGPGTNASHFREQDYLGVDINPGYVKDAERRFGPRFRVADVTTMRLEPGGGWDCILVNSLLHHLPDDAVDRLLGHLATLLTEDGAVHILDLVLPPHASLARLLARLDRGDYPRPLERWRELFSLHFALDLFEPYPLGAGGLTLWSMVYGRGRPLR
ncbi:MAG TPA: class I SAM-dependent methyltransferase [Gemmatimonadales bacterium]|nr:class I SAM-dependent methyltransferase [Gemmatimonadales bacterium]